MRGAGGEGEGELRGGEEVGGSEGGLQEVDDGDGGGEADVRGGRAGAALAVFLVFELEEPPGGHR